MTKLSPVGQGLEVPQPGQVPRLYQGHGDGKHCFRVCWCCAAALALWSLSDHWCPKLLYGEGELESGCLHRLKAAHIQIEGAVLGAKISCLIAQTLHKEEQVPSEALCRWQGRKSGFLGALSSPRMTNVLQAALQSTPWCTELCWGIFSSLDEKPSFWIRAKKSIHPAK